MTDPFIDDIGSGTSVAIDDDIDLISSILPTITMTTLQIVATTIDMSSIDQSTTGQPATSSSEPNMSITSSSSLYPTVPANSFNKQTIDLLFIFILVIISFVLLIAVALTLLVGICLCRRNSSSLSSSSNHFHNKMGKDEELSLSSYSGKFEVIRPNTLRSITGQACADASTFGFPQIVISDANQPHELISYDVPTSLLPMARPPSQVTPRNSARVSLYPTEQADHGSEDYDDVDGDDVNEFEMTDYIEPYDSLNQVQESSWYNFSSFSNDPNQSPPTPPVRYHSMADRMVSNCSDYVDDDHIYMEPLEPSMLSGNNSPTHTGMPEGLPYAPIYDITLPNKKIRVYHTSHQSVRIIQELGRGHFGKVYLAATIGISLKDLKLNDDSDTSRSLLVAIKQLKITADSNLKDAFQKEVRFMSQLHHPNVARLLAVADGGIPFIMMEYMENGDLNEFLRKQEIQQDNVPFLEENEVTPLILLYIAVQIASGMKYLASKKFVHRDLATRNCLVGRDFVTKISDFGMSRNIYDTSYYRVGSHLILPIRWMATETFYGKFSVKSDAWSFGVTMWELYTLCRCVPYTDISDNDVIADALIGENRQILPRPSNCPFEVYDLLLRCFEHRINLRADFEEIYARLFVVYSNLGQSNMSEDT